MFTLRGLLSSDSQSKEIEEDYIQASSVIMDGSIFDRRKIDDSRRASRRRKGFGEMIVGLEKRLHEERRITFGRRSTDEIIEGNNKKEVKLNDVDVLIEEQQATFAKIKELSHSTKEMEFHKISGQLKALTLDIKYLLKKEESLLHLSLNLNGNNANDEVKGSLTKLELYIHNISEQVLRLLDKHQTTKVTATNVGTFLLDLKSIEKTLTVSLEEKKKYLYPLYNRLHETY